MEIPVTSSKFVFSRETARGIVWPDSSGAE